MPDVTVFMTFFVLYAALDGHVVAEHQPDGFPEGFGSVDHEKHSLLHVEAAVDQVGEQRGHDRRVLGRAVPEAERELVALGGDPERDDVRAAVQLDPVEHHHRQSHVHERAVHQVPQLIAGALHERAGHRRLRRRPRVGLHLGADWLLHATVLPGRDAGEHPLKHHIAELIAIGEMLIGHQRHLALTVSGPGPRALDPDAPASERDLPVLMAVADRRAVRVPAALRTDELADLQLQ